MIFKIQEQDLPYYKNFVQYMEQQKILQQIDKNLNNQCFEWTGIPEQIELNDYGAYIILRCKNKKQ